MTLTTTYEKILDTRQVNMEARCCLFVRKKNKNISPSIGGTKVNTKKIVDWLYIPKIKKINGILTMAAPST